MTNDNVGRIVITAKPVYLAMVTEIAVNNHRFTNGKSCKKANRNKYNNNDKDPDKGN